MQQPAAAAAAARSRPRRARSAAGPRRSHRRPVVSRSEHGVDIATLRGSGPGGEILADDILKAAASVARCRARSLRRPRLTASTAFSRHLRLSRAHPEAARRSIGRIMAERTTQSWTTVPHFFVTRDVDATALNATRERWIPIIEQSHGVKVTHTDLIVAAVARALQQHPRMNGSWANDAISSNADVNVRWRWPSRTPSSPAVIQNTDRHRPRRHREARKDLTERARANKLQPADITGATFTISNLGMFEVDAFTAIIVPPQAGILAVGAIDRSRGAGERACIGVTPMMTLTLSSRPSRGRRRPRRGSS